MDEKKTKRFYEDDPDTLEFSDSPVREAERKRAEQLWKDQQE